MNALKVVSSACGLTVPSSQPLFLSSLVASVSLCCLWDDYLSLVFRVMIGGEPFLVVLVHFVDTFLEFALGLLPFVNWKFSWCGLYFSF